MTQFEMTQAERIEALEALEYNPAEAQFLDLASLHSGYFLRPQAAAHLAASGAKVEHFIEKLFDNGHVSAIAFAPEDHLYHLCNRTFYALIGQADNRNRRTREVSTIKNKLMGLDYVLGHGGSRFLATETDKLNYFRRVWGVDETVLPARLYTYGDAAPAKRYFVEKYPIAVPHEGAKEPARFCFVDEGLTTASHFETFLGHYERLVCALGDVEVVYVAAKRRPFQGASKTFERYAARWAHGGQKSAALLNRLTTYFALRERYEARDFSTFDRAQLADLRCGQSEFAGPTNDDLFHAWKQRRHRIIDLLVCVRIDHSYRRSRFIFNSPFGAQL